MKLVNKMTGRPYCAGQIVEYKGRMKRITHINAEKRLLFLAGENGIPNPTLAQDIGAEWRDPTVGRPHGMTKKEAMDRYYKQVIARENSLAGGRCSSTGLSGMARIEVEKVFAEQKGRDMRGARAGIKQAEMVRPDQATVTGRMESIFLDEELHAAAKSAQLGFTQHKLYYALALAGFDVKLIDGPEFDAILAGLRLLAYERPRMQEDDGIIDILTSAGAHDGLSAEQINALGDRLQGG